MNRSFLSIALPAAVFACTGLASPPPDRTGAGRQTVAATSTLVLPFNLGASTIGGLEGTLIRVTALAADGPGSLRQALEDPRPRLVVFDVGGVIDLQGHSLDVRNPWLTVAGQTAPDPGITLIRGSLSVETHDVLIQHIAVRPGDGGPKSSYENWSPDALGAHRGSS